MFTTTRVNSLFSNVSYLIFAFMLSNINKYVLNKIINITLGNPEL